MKFKKLVVLIIVLAILVAMTVVKKVQENGKNKIKPSSAVKVLHESLSPDSIQKVVISKGDEPDNKIILRKSDADQWVLESRFGTRARNGQVETLIKSAAELKGEIRSESKEVLSDFSLLESQAVQIQFLGPEDKKIAGVLVSPLRTAGELNFVRPADSDQVIAASPDILSTLGIYEKDGKLDSKFFFDLQVIKFDPSKVTNFEIRDKETLSFVKTENADKTVQWILEQAKPNEALDESKITSFFSSLANLYAKDPADPGTRFDEKPAFRVTFLKDEKPSQIEIYLGSRDEAKKTQYLKVMPDNLAYEINVSIVDNVKKDRTFFLKNRAQPAA